MLTQKGGSPGRVVIGGDSWSEGCGFESQHCTQDGHFFTYICCKNCLFVWKDENKQKEAGNGPFKKKHWHRICNTFQYTVYSKKMFNTNKFLLMTGFEPTALPTEPEPLSQAMS